MRTFKPIELYQLSVFLLFILILLKNNILIAQPGRDWHRNVPIEKLRPEDFEKSNNEDEFSSVVGTALIVAGFIWAASSSGSNSNKTYSTSNNNTTYRNITRRIRQFRPPAISIGINFPVYKTRINDHWARGGLGDLQLDLLLFGIRGRNTSFGAYGYFGGSHYDYTLPHYERQYLLGGKYIRNGDANQQYALNLTKEKSDKNAKKRVYLAERTLESGITLRTFFRPGIFIDVGGGIKFNRRYSLRFNEGYNYLESRNSLINNNFENVIEDNNEALFINIPNSYATFSIGFYSRDTWSPFSIVFSGRLYNIDFVDTGYLDLWYLDETGSMAPVTFDQQSAFSINLGVRFWMSRRSKR